MKKFKMKTLSSLPKKIQLLMIAVAIICAGILVTTFLNKADATTNQHATNQNIVRTLTLKKSSLEQTVSATGNMDSQDTSNVTTNVDATIKTVLVSVGDTVKEGDVICTLDSSELQKKIDKAKETQATIKETNQTSYDNALAAKEVAWSAYYSQKTNTENLYTTYQNAVSAFQAIEGSVTTQQTLFNEAEKALLSVGIMLSQKEGACLSAGFTSDCSDDPSTAQSDEYQIAKADHDTAQFNFNTAKTNFEQAKSNTNYDSLYNAMMSAKNSYETSNTQLIKYLETFSSSDARVNETYKTLNTSTSTSSEYSDYVEQLDNYTLKAKSEGKITTLNATIGSKASGTIATIQNTNSLKSTFTIDEYDIQKISVGMKTRITSDAIDEELEGIVTQISPTASTSAQGTSSGFQVEVEVTSSNSQLLIGMSVKVEILISTTDNVFTVPLDAIETKEDGSTVVYVQDTQGEFHETEVTIGSTTDYYAEISGTDITEGLILRASAIEEVTVSDETESVDMSAIPGGGMAPSGSVNTEMESMPRDLNGGQR